MVMEKRSFLKKLDNIVGAGLVIGKVSLSGGKYLMPDRKSSGGLLRVFITFELGFSVHDHWAIVHQGFERSESQGFSAAFATPSRDMLHLMPVFTLDWFQV